MRPALRGFWLLSGCTALALMVGAATELQAHRQLAWVETWVEEGSRPAETPRADEAIASWLRPWTETYLRERGLSPKSALPLQRCARDFLTALDHVSDTANVVRFDHIEKAVSDATLCTRPPIGDDHATDFVKQLRSRWGAWLQRQRDAQQPADEVTPPGLGRLAPPTEAIRNDDPPED